MSRPPALIKIGGNLLENAASHTEIAGQIARLMRAEVPLMVVHGGGIAISAGLRQAGIDTEFVGGMRRTGDEAIAIVEEVLARINAALVAAVCDAGGKAVGLIGSQGLLFSSPMTADGRSLGRVGSVHAVDAGPALTALNDGCAAIIAPTGADKDSGLSYNINADVAAAALAASCNVADLLLVSDVAGVLDADGRRLSRLTSAQASRLIAEGVIADGMVPKVEQAVQAVKRGVQSVHILSGHRPDALYDQLTGQADAGTRITG